MSYGRINKFDCAEKRSKQRKKITALKIANLTDDTGSSSSEEDLKDLIETLRSYETSTPGQESNQNENGSRRASAEDIYEYASDNSLYETADSESPSNKSPLSRGSRSTIKTGSSSESNLLESEIKESSDDSCSNGSVTYSPSHSQNLLSSQAQRKSYNTSIDQFLSQYSQGAQESSLCSCEEGNQYDVPSLRERCFVFGIPETTIDEGITRIIPIKFVVDENSCCSLPKQLLHQMSSPEGTIYGRDELTTISAKNDTSSVNTSNHRGLEVESSSPDVRSSSSLSSSSFDTSSDRDEVLKGEIKSNVSGVTISKQLDSQQQSSSPDFRSTLSNESSENGEQCPFLAPRKESSASSSIKTHEGEHSSSLSYNSEQEEERLVRRNDYQTMLDYLNLKSSDDSDESSESSRKRCDSLVSSLEKSFHCSSSARSPYDYSKEQQSFPETTSTLQLNTNSNTNEPDGMVYKERQRKVFQVNSSSDENEFSTNRHSFPEEFSNASNVNKNTNISPLNGGHRKENKKSMLTGDNSERRKELDHLLYSPISPIDNSSDDSLDESALLEFHDENCEKTAAHSHKENFDFKDFDVKEIDLALSHVLLHDTKPMSSTSSDAKERHHLQHHDERPNEADTVDKILRLGADDVALNRLKSSSKGEKLLQSVDGTVIDSELQAHPVDFTKPRAVDEDTFYWVPCDFKDYLQVSDRPLVSDYFPKDSPSAQFCCVMVREFVHVHFYLRLHPKSQPSYAKYNILIWDKNRQPVAHFRTPCPIYFDAGHAHHVSTFSNQAMLELLAQEMLVVSCHVTSFAKWEKTDDANTPWYFSNGVRRLKSMDDMQSLYCSHEYADVTLESSDGQKFPAHRAVVCRESQLFKQNVDSSSSKFVKLNINGRLLKQMLYVFYTGELPPVEELEKATVPLPRWQEICELLVAADRYQAGRLSRKCQAWLGLALGQENVCTIYALAVRLGLPSLTHACRSYITKHREIVVKSAEWLTLKDSPAAVADLLLNTDIYDRQGGTQHLQIDTDSDLHCLNEFSITANNFERKMTFKDILYEFGYTPNP